MNYRTLAFSVLFLFLLPLSYCRAQVPPSRAEEERRRQEAQRSHAAKVAYRDEALPRWLFFDFGGNTSTIYEKIGNKPSALPSISAFTSDTNLWMDIQLFDTHRFYSRFRMTYLDQDFTDATEEHGFVGDLEELYYAADLGNLFKIRSLADQPFQARVTVGRQWLTLGQGMTYADISDGVKTEMAWGKLQAQLFVAQTIKQYFNIDTSVPGRHNDRNFFGGEMRYEASNAIQPYILFLVEHDHCRENPRDPFRNYDYNARYLGLGLEGEPMPGLTYHAEYIRQSGTSMGESIENPALMDRFGNVVYVPTVMSIHKERIRAYALDIGVDYEFQRPDKPLFSFGYIHGSGDPDRLIPGSTVGGNLAYTHDRGFMEFGYVPVGYVLDPMVSNIHIFRNSFAVTPFYDKKPFDTLRFGISHYFFRKHKLTGGISDQAALRDHKGVGQEVDLFVTWDPLRDVSIGVEYGMFFPGRAYEHRDMNDYFMFSFTYRF